MCPPVEAARPGVLIVDDDPGVLYLVAMALQQQGFAVWQASSGRGALEVFRREGDRIDLALLDVRMPGLDGPQTLAELRRLAPDLACCFMSGHTAPYTVEDLHNLGAVHCFEKPFRLDDVARCLWEVVPRGVKGA